jgi:hypothetical protein
VVSPPRFSLVPAGAVDSRGARAVELARNAGLHLTEEQQAVLHGGLGIRADGTWTAFEVVNIQGRQCGKSATLAARIMLGLELGEQIAYTSHRVDSSQEVFRAVAALVQDSPELSPLLDKVFYGNGKERIELTNGGRVIFGTRSARTGRGFSLDTWLADEAHILGQAAHDSLMPAMSARERPPQVWYCATAADEEVHGEDALVLSRLRDRGLRAIRGEARAENLALSEWSVGLFDDEGVELRPEQVTTEMLDDEAVWLPAVPAHPARISLDHLRAEKEAMSFRGWLVERCCIGAWADVTGVAGARISGEKWAELCDRNSTRTGDIVLTFDVGRDRHSALFVCGRRGSDSLLHPELLKSGPGTAWLVEQLAYMSERYDIHAIAADDYGGNRALLPVLEEAGLTVRMLSGGETVAACSKFEDLVNERAFRHIGQVEVAQALRGAKTKAVGDAWCWSRKASSGDAAIVVALTLALAVGSELPDEPWEPQVF